MPKTPKQTMTFTITHTGSPLSERDFRLVCNDVWEGVADYLIEYGDEGVEILALGGVQEAKED